MKMDPSLAVKTKALKLAEELPKKIATLQSVMKKVDDEKVNAECQKTFTHIRSTFYDDTDDTMNDLIDLLRRKCQNKSSNFAENLERLQNEINLIRSEKD